jgi:5'-nucleotidase
MGVNRTSVTLAWQPPAGDGGAPITGYQVQLQAVTRAARTELGAEWLIVYDGPSTATAFSALHAGCSYMARVSATNSAGASPFSAAVQFVTSPDVPAAPPVPDAEVDATVRGLGGSTQAWQWLGWTGQA